MRKVMYAAVVCLGTYGMYGAAESWTWSFKKFFSADELQRTEDAASILLTRTDIPLFTQCVVSWNAYRPKRGYFTLWTQARHAKTQQWGSWHKMVSWGRDVQASYFTRLDPEVVYHHVRLEMPLHDRADGIRIKITKHDGASFDTLRMISACLSDFTLFEHESIDACALLPTVKVKGVPAYSQMILDHPKREVICSPTSLSMVVSYLQKEHVNPSEFADNSFDTGLQAYGSWPFNIAHAFERCNGSTCFRVVRCNTFAELHARLMSKIPVVVSVRGAIKGAPQEYNKGHLLVVVGWDCATKRVLCHDPAWDCNEKVAVSYDAESFIRAWERSRRLAYFIDTPHTL